MKFIPEAVKVWWKLWSIRLNAIGLAILGYIQIDPIGALGVWNMMPAEVRRYLPPQLLLLIGMIFFALSMLARLVRQPKLEDKTDGYFKR